MEILKQLVSPVSSDGSGNFSTLWTGVISLVASYVVAFAAKHGVVVTTGNISAILYQALLTVGMVATAFGGVKRVGNMLVRR